MSKRLPLAILLSALVLFVWSIFNPRPERQGQRDPAAGRQVQAPAAAGELGSRGVAGPGIPEQVALDSQASPEFPETRIQGSGDGKLLVREIGGAADQQGAYQAIFSERGGVLKALRFRGYYTQVGLSEDDRQLSDNWLELLRSIDTGGAETGSLLLTTSQSSQDLVPEGLDQVDWKMESLEPSEGVGVRFTYGPGNGLIFEKRIQFEPRSWRIHLRLTVRNVSHSAAGRSTQFGFIPAGVVPPELNETFYPEPSAIAMGIGKSADDEEAATQSAPGLEESGALDIDMTHGGVIFAGVHNKYFAFLMRPEDDAARKSMNAPVYFPVKAARDARLPEEEQAIEYIGLRVPLSLTIPAKGASLERDFAFYAGPKERSVFLEDFPKHRALLESDLASGSFCISFNSIGNGLLWFLGIIHDVVGNWGLAIIILTLAVRALLFPINRRSQTAMARYQKKMKRVTPRINEIKERFKNDPQKLREAQAKIMQEEKAFPPLGGCLPMFLQLPVFFGLFSMLRTSFDLRQEPFYGWIDDLSRPDQLAQINLPLPLIGEIEYFNLLPILMVIMWILQQRGMPQPQDEQAARMQKMMTFMPVIFGFMLYNYAAGLSLYMLTSSTVAIFEQKVIKKKWPIDDTEIISDKPGGCGPFSGFAAKLAEKQKEQMKLMQQRQGQQAGQAKKRKKR